VPIRSSEAASVRVGLFALAGATAYFSAINPEYRRYVGSLSLVENCEEPKSRFGRHRHHNAANDDNVRDDFQTFQIEHGLVPAPPILLREQLHLSSKKRYRCSTGFLNSVELVTSPVVGPHLLPTDSRVLYPSRRRAGREPVPARSGAASKA
jgi:hypothetical protein